MVSTFPSRAVSSAGYTLIELLVAALILVAVTGLATSLFSHTRRAFSRETLAARTENDLVATKNIFLDDVSVAGYLRTPTTTFIEVDTAASILTFEADMDSDTDVDRVCYQLDSGNVGRKMLAAGTACGTEDYEVLIRDVTAFTMTFRNAAGTILMDAEVVAGAAPGPARHVDLVVTASPAVGSVSLTKSVHGQVTLRN